MKKFITLTLMLLLMLSCAACSQSTDDGGETAEASPNKWGVTLEAENVTPGGLTLACHQSGGEDVAELNTGSYFVLQRLEDGGYVDVALLPQEHELAWTAEAWIIQPGGTTRWDINWEFLYGELPAGEYRIGKPITNFRGPGDYDQETLYADFVVE